MCVCVCVCVCVRVRVRVRVRVCRGVVIRAHGEGLPNIFISIFFSVSSLNISDYSDRKKKIIHLFHTDIKILCFLFR